MTLRAADTLLTPVAEAACLLAVSSDVRTRTSQVNVEMTAIVEQVNVEMTAPISPIRSAT